MLTLITPTGERQEAFALCQQMMARQTFSGKVRWIIVDDGETSQAVTLRRRNWRIEVLRPQPFWRIGDNTQGRNLQAALEWVDPEREKIVIVEDDDYIGPGWLQCVSRNIGKAELIGEREAIYYNVRKRTWRALHNKSHACLRCTAMRGDAIRRFRDILQAPDRYYDLKLWRAHGDKMTLPRRHTLGIKGMPGRQGIAEGHDGKTGRDDSSLEKLRELIGEDADWYEPFYREAGVYCDELYALKQTGAFAPGERYTEALSRSAQELLVAAGVLARKTVKRQGSRHGKADSPDAVYS